MCDLINVWNCPVYDKPRFERVLFFIDKIFQIRKNSGEKGVTQELLLMLTRGNALS
jgi:hypothetical protein